MRVQILLEAQKVGFMKKKSNQIKRIKLKFNKIDLDEEIEDALEDLVDFSMQTSSMFEAMMEGEHGVSDTLVDKHFETIDKLKCKVVKMYRFKK